MDYGRSSQPSEAERVSGSTETKTYGKGATGREREEKQTFPKIGLFGKDVDERARLCKDVRTIFSAMERPFSGKLRYTSITWCRRVSP